MDNKEFRINGLLQMSLTESRFPLLLNTLRKWPNIFYIVPASVYKSVYGLYQQIFSCPFNAEIILNSLVKIKNVYHLLKDEESKLVFLNLLMYRLTLNREYIQRAYSMEPQYFISSFRGLKSDEVYVDCGAYNGDSFVAYCQYNEFPKSAYLFEPDRKNKELMTNLLQDYKALCKLTIVDKGAYKKTGSLYFMEGRGVNSYFTEQVVENGIRLNVTSIDDSVFEDVSFIKMDIEGFEKEALLGAKNQICKNYPKLAICVYHYSSDLWEIPLMIASLFPQYKNYKIRHHSKSSSETVLYVY